MRAPDQARAAKGRSTRQVCGIRDPESVRHRLRAGPRRALPEPPLRGGAKGLGGTNPAATLAVSRCAADAAPKRRGLLMSRFFKSAAFPILIVVVLAFFAQKLIGNSTKQQKQTFGNFVNQLDSGQVKSLSLDQKSNSAT